MQSLLLRGKKKEKTRRSMNMDAEKTDHIMKKKQFRVVTMGMDFILSKRYLLNGEAQLPNSPISFREQKRALRPNC